MTNPLIFVLLPILSGLLLYVLKSRYSRYLALIPQGFLLGLSLYILHSFSRGNDQQISSLLAGVPLPFGMSLQYDNLTAIFLVITNLLFLLMVVFDFNKTTINYFFIFFFLSLQGLVNGVFLSTDFFNVYVVLEAATVVVTILIMFKKRIQALYDGMIYLMVNMVAMAFFLFGIGYLYKLVGVLDFASVSESIVLLSSPRDLALPLGFLLTAVVVKSAAFPMFSWLPKAHGAHSSPYVVSAVLSGIFVMTGVYLTLRIYQVFLPVIDLAPYLFVIGLITSITGFCLAISQKDIKLILAYSSVSHVGLVMSGLYGQSPYGYAGGIYHIFAHALFKGMLFLLAGLLIGVFGTRRITDMHGLWRDNKLMSIAVVAGVLSITGAPFFSGGFSKYMISYGYSSIYFKGLYTLINAGTMISFIKFLKILPTKGHAPNHIVLSNPKSAVLILMSTLCLVMGLFGQSIASYLFGTAPNYSLLQQIQKLPMYLLTFGASYLLYEKILHHFNLEAMVAKLELSFNGMMVAMSGFFAFTLVYLIKFGF